MNRVRTPTLPCPTCGQGLRKLTGKKPTPPYEHLTTSFFWCESCEKLYKAELKEMIIKSKEE